MDSISRFVSEAFGTKSYYEILNIDKSSSGDEVRRAYRRLALIYHPDRIGGDAEKFKALSVVHSTLSDSGKREIYDADGTADDECNDGSYDDSYEYFRKLFPTLTVTKLEEFAATYKGSEEERQDLISAYNKFIGNLDKIMDTVIFAEIGEEIRLCDTIDGIIAFGDLVVTKDYEKWRSKIRKAALKPSKQKRKVANGTDTEADLAALILSRKTSRVNGVAAVMAKYGGAELTFSNDISDEAFMLAQSRIQKSSKSTRNREG